MKIWFAFGYSQYYPAGGTNDFLAAANTEQELRLKITGEKGWDQIQIETFDTEKMKFD